MITTNERLKAVIEVIDDILNDCEGIDGIFNLDDPDVMEVAEDADYQHIIYVYGLTPLEFAELKGWYDWKKEAAWAKREEEWKKQEEVDE